MSEDGNISSVSFPRLAIDAMGGDKGPGTVVAGAALAVKNGLNAQLNFSAMRHYCALFSISIQVLSAHKSPIALIRWR